jgi:hypothetical protein
VYIHLIEVKDLLLWLTCFLDMHTTNPIMVKFHDKCEWQNGFTPDKEKGGLVWNTDGSKTNQDPGATVYSWSLRREHIFSLGLSATLFQAAIYCTMLRYV